MADFGLTADDDKTRKNDGSELLVGLKPRIRNPSSVTTHDSDETAMRAGFISREARPATMPSRPRKIKTPVEQSFPTSVRLKASLLERFIEYCRVHAHDPLRPDETALSYSEAIERLLNESQGR